MKKRALIIVAIVVAAGAWYAFRPELLFVDQKVSEGFPSASAATNTPATGPRQLAKGQFKGYAHETEGNAEIFEVEGKRVLRLTNFKTSNGPDVHVYLVAAKDAMDDKTVKAAGFVDLGPMKGNIGDQNYDVPANVDLNKYAAVTIWCARFSVNFGTAPMSAAV
jgi:hypothetical protein